MPASAIQKARIESEAIGFEKGEAIGLEKGDTLRGKKVVLWMLNKGTFSLQEIAEASGFSIDEIEQLQESMFITT